ncbi:hypothetical protein [Streptomyces sp. NPDC052114]|uniref:hypothetical protein n=1 Tax=unclassified Streptomyces TaxID=2593676 RepID=UPI003435BBD7
MKINKKGRITGPTAEPANMPEFRGTQELNRYRSAARTFMSGGPSGTVTMPDDAP